MGNGSYDAFHWLYPPMYHKEGLWLDDVAPLTKAVGIPVICPGKIIRPEMADEAIREGKITAVALGRALLADSDWVNKAASGKPEDIRPCIGCNVGCIGRIFAGKTMLCAVNANLFHEAEQALIPAETPKKVAVIGGGVGGMEVARIAARRGHDVTIYEKADRLGGMTLVANVPDYKNASRRLLKWFEKDIREAGVKVELNREFSVDDVKNLDADAFVISTGAFPKIPRIPGVERENVTTAIDALLGKAEIGQNVVVVGGGQVGCEVAYELLRDGKRVAVVEFLNGLMAGGKEPVSAAVVLMLQDLLNYYKADIRLSSALKEIRENSVLIEKDGSTQELPADTVIMATGFVENNSLYNALKDSGKEVYVVGDARRSPGNIMRSVADDNEVGRKI
ncbi:MAG: FAD-dependent oxidoreductase [Oscillibacter sp.]|nr:FAD-dependent oxidoreductase [Oscillibacter sp.]